MTRKKNTVAATLLLVTPETVRWMDGELKQIRTNHGVSLGRTTVARAVLSGLYAAKASFATCRSEFEIQDRVWELVRIAAAATEVK